MPGAACAKTKGKKKWGVDIHEHSKAQWRFLFAKEKRGELPKGEALHHARMSKKEGRPYGSLPERVNSAQKKAKAKFGKKKGRR